MDSHYERKLLRVIPFHESLPLILKAQRYIKWWFIRRKLKAVLATNKLTRSGQVANKQALANDDRRYCFAYRLSNNILISIISYD